MLKKFVLISFIILIIILLNPNINTSQIKTELKSKNSIPTELPIAKLKINSIGVDNYIFNYNSKNNTVEKNVQLLEKSIFPDNEQSIIFLAAHSGNSSVSYFNDLNKLRYNDTVEFYYSNYKYTYIVSKIYEQKKDGYIEIKRTFNHQLILTTCSTSDKKKQLIISCNLLKKEKV